jgi:hypothetical protein
MRAKWVAEAEAELNAAARWYEDRKEGIVAILRIDHSVRWFGHAL